MEWGKAEGNMNASLRQGVGLMIRAVVFLWELERSIDLQKLLSRSLSVRVDIILKGAVTVGPSDCRILVGLTYKLASADLAFL